MHEVFKANKKPPEWSHLRLLCWLLLPIMNTITNSCLCFNLFQPFQVFWSEMDQTHYFNTLMTSVLHHIETSQSICRANQLTGFYMMGSTGR